MFLKSKTTTTTILEAASIESVLSANSTTNDGMAFLDILAIVAIISTLAMFLTGISICQSIKRRGSTEGISAVPFLACLVSCIFWLRYGFLKHDRTVIFINSAGLLLEIAYVAYYYIKTVRKGPLKRQLAISAALCGAMLVYIDLVSPPFETAVNHLGMMCLTLNILNFGAPLAGMSEVIRTKSAESLPFHLILANLIVALEWFLYGYLIKDVYMTVPNAIGMLLSIAQLGLFAVYPPPARKSVR